MASHERNRAGCFVFLGWGCGKMDKSRESISRGRNVAKKMNKSGESIFPDPNAFGKMNKAAESISPDR